MKKAKRAFGKIFRRMKRRDQRLKRKRSRSAAFASHQVESLVKFDQKLVVMGK